MIVKERKQDRRLLLALSVSMLCCFAAGASAQSSLGGSASQPGTLGTEVAPMTGESSGLAPLEQKPAFGGLTGPVPLIHHDALRHPCVEIHGYSQPQKVNPDVYDHILQISNRCSETIKLHICYYQTEDCIDVSARPYDNQLETLGIFAHMPDFRWEYTENCTPSIYSPLKPANCY
ncbi:MAG TPA: hypothetical protein VKV77_04795 [Methylovirgula sp.]|nr:hypothetical protein [Methylovirgula sp.]